MTAGLTPRMVRVIEGIAAGDERVRIADRLGIAEATVTREVDRACHALLLRGNQHAALVDAAIRRGVITLPPCPRGDLEEYLVDTLELIMAGRTNAEIAAELWLSLDAVKSRVKRILRALNANNRAHAVAIGWQRGILRHSWEVAA